LRWYANINLHAWHPLANALQGWVLGEVNRAQDGISLVKEAIAELDAISTTVHRGRYLTILVELHARCGDFAAALDAARDAHEYLRQVGHHLWHAELHRIEGEVLRQAGAANEQVERCFVEAIDLARRQEAKSYELRAATSLARLWRDQERYRDAGDLLRPIYEWFTEGFDTPDLIEARTLLEELRRPG
jgi:predicted ATPase